MNSGDLGCPWAGAALSDCTSDGELASGVSASATFLRVLAFLFHRGRSWGWLTAVNEQRRFSLLSDYDINEPSREKTNNVVSEQV